MGNNITLLAIDTAHDACNVGLIKDGKTQVLSTIMKHGQSETLIPMINDIMIQSNVSIENVDGIVVNVGPGKFTGIRVGIAAAKGLSLPHNKPIYPMTSCEMFLSGIINKNDISNYDIIATAINSGRENIFWQEFDINSIAKSNVIDFSPENLLMHLDTLQQKKIIIVGDYLFSDNKKDFFKANGITTMYAQHPCAKSSLLLAIERINNNHEWIIPRPIYCRDADVSIQSSETII